MGAAAFLGSVCVRGKVLERTQRACSEDSRQEGREQTQTRVLPMSSTGRCPCHSLARALNVRPRNDAGRCSRPLHVTCPLQGHGLSGAPFALPVPNAPGVFSVPGILGLGSAGGTGEDSGHTAGGGARPSASQPALPSYREQLFLVCLCN